MRQMADNVAGTRWGRGNVSWDFDGHCHRDLQREREGREERERGREGREMEQGSTYCAVDAGASLAK